jgi:hypothetical protein
VAFTTYNPDAIPRMSRPHLERTALGLLQRVEYLEDRLARAESGQVSQPHPERPDVAAWINANPNVVRLLPRRSAAHATPIAPLAASPGDSRLGA